MKTDLENAQDSRNIGVRQIHAGGGGEISCPNIFSSTCPKIICLFARNGHLKNSRGWRLHPLAPPPPLRLVYAPRNLVILLQLTAICILFGEFLYLYLRVVYIFIFVPLHCPECFRRGVVLDLRNGGFHQQRSRSTCYPGENKLNN